MAIQHGKGKLGTFLDWRKQSRQQRETRQSPSQRPNFDGDIGKVGEDPGASWSDSDGNYWTKDHTLRRKNNILSGVNFNPGLFDPTLEWDSLPANTFNGLGVHECNCGSSIINEINSDFKIYPNPVRMKEKVFISNKYTVDEINIYNQLGKLISTNKYNSNNIIVDISNFTSGIYFVSLKDQTGIKTRTIVLENE